MRLHGGDTDVADIDVLTSASDGAAIIRAWPGAVTIGAPDGRFRSHPFARLAGEQLPIEIMAALEVNDGTCWRAVRPRSRVMRRGVAVPSRAELVAILRLFAREKDMKRAALLEAGGPSQ